MSKEAATKITFTGYINKNEIHQWYSIADIGVITYYTEQYSYTPLEMMNHSLPIVTTNGFGIRNIFASKNTAIITEIGDRGCPQIFQKNLSKEILRLLNYPSLCSKIGKNAYKVVKLNYIFERMQKEYESNRY